MNWFSRARKRPTPGRRYEGETGRRPRGTALLGSLLLAFGHRGLIQNRIFKNQEMALWRALVQVHSRPGWASGPSP
jgi:hypothetical protein